MPLARVLRRLDRVAAQLVVGVAGVGDPVAGVVAPARGDATGRPLAGAVLGGRERRAGLAVGHRVVDVGPRRAVAAHRVAHRHQAPVGVVVELLGGQARGPGPPLVMHRLGDLLAEQGAVVGAAARLAVGDAGGDVLLVEVERRPYAVRPGLRSQLAIGVVAGRERCTCGILRPRWSEALSGRGIDLGPPSPASSLLVVDGG
jgi:hypothetical protein